MTTALFLRIAARDRALLTRWAIGQSASRNACLIWLAITHLGGAFCTIAMAVLPLVGGLADQVSADAAMTLVGSHLLVQLVKRTVSRPRPSLGKSYAALVRTPDRFSFPSGHSAAAMSVAFAYAVAYPSLAAPLFMIATAVGLSRVTLGAHYPGDVFVGQLMGVLTGTVVIAF